MRFSLKQHVQEHRSGTMYVVTWKEEDLRELPVVPEHEAINLLHDRNLEQVLHHVHSAHANKY